MARLTGVIFVTFQIAHVSVISLSFLCHFSDIFARNRDEFSTFMLLQSSSGEKEESEGNKYGIEHVTEGLQATGHGNHVAHVSQIAYSDAHLRYYTGSLDGTVRVWSGKNMAHFRTIYNEDGWVNDLCILGKLGSQEHELLAVATNRSVTFYNSGSLELKSRVHTTAPIDLRGGRGRFFPLFLRFSIGQCRNCPFFRAF